MKLVVAGQSERFRIVSYRIVSQPSLISVTRTRSWAAEDTRRMTAPSMASMTSTTLSRKPPGIPLIVPKSRLDRVDQPGSARAVGASFLPSFLPSSLELNYPWSIHLKYVSHLPSPSPSTLPEASPIHPTLHLKWEASESPRALIDRILCASSESISRITSKNESQP